MTRPAINACLVLPVTSQAPAHFDFTRPFDTRHRSDVPVAITADSSSANMHHMREVDKIRNPIDPDPWNRFFILPVGHELFYFRRILSNKEVAGPAISNCRYAGNRRLRSIAVTKEARDAVVTGVDLVAEGDRLDWRAVKKIER